jgi:DNA-binding SARP family transcriptional activator
MSASVGVQPEHTVLLSVRQFHEAAGVRRQGPSTQPGDLQLRLLEGFDLRFRGIPATVPGGGRRVIAFLALHGRPLQRGYVAGSLWPDVSDVHAGALLRGALSRLRRAGLEAVTTIGDRLQLDPGVDVDIHEISAAADQLSRGEPILENIADLLRTLAGDLLPDWYEDWVLVERERYQQLRLHALEALCAALTTAGKFSFAVQAGLAAVAADPLRESAQRVLIDAYLGEGNPSEAVRQYERYRETAARELGLAPTQRLETLIKTAWHSS